MRLRRIIIIKPQFHNVSFPQFASDIAGERYEDIDQETKEKASALYRDLQTPQRATASSAGYDFFAPFSIDLAPGEKTVVPTGIRAEMPDDKVLLIFPRSSLGFRYQMCLTNTVGVIDSDYFHADNEGHIQVSIVNRGDQSLVIKKGERFVQGIFAKFLTTFDDSPASEERTGGMGSTGK